MFILPKTDITEHKFIRLNLNVLVKLCPNRFLMGIYKKDFTVDIRHLDN